LFDKTWRKRCVTIHARPFSVSGSGLTSKAEFRSGCLIGNFSVEASDESERIRERLTEIFKEISDSIVYCLQAAVDAGELSASNNVRELAGFLYSSLQGAILQSKVEQSVEPIKRFKGILFTRLLR
jgi:TetR/AcrR family transcriptional repressor of nem operon